MRVMKISDVVFYETSPSQTKYIPMPVINDQEFGRSCSPYAGGNRPDADLAISNGPPSA